MSRNDVIKRPRLYVDSDLQESSHAVLGKEQAHYLLHVLRCRSGDGLRLFNGRDGEWYGIIETASKKDISIRLESKIKEQPAQMRAVHLFFTPIKKARLDWLVEKAVELGATHLHPVLTQNTEVRAINETRIRTQIIEAAEQCERMDAPALLPLKPLFSALPDMVVLACLERMGATPLRECLPQEKESVAFLIGPEGGFTIEEKEKLCALSNVKPVSLGPRILRSETAAITALCTIE